MSTDRKLLELAAKAVGYAYNRMWFDQESGLLVWEPPTNYESRNWNPLTDDGDALRLAVKLNLTIKIMGDYVKVGWRGCDERWPGEDVPVNADQVMPIATRRAIVRAAAEIGKALP